MDRTPTDETATDEGWPVRALRAPEASAWLRRTFEAWRHRRPALRERFDALLARPVGRAEIDALLAERLIAAAATHAPDDVLGVALRETRQVVLAAVVERDARGDAPLAEVCGAMTDLAEAAAGAAARTAAAEQVARFGLPRGSDGRVEDLLVVGMGKLGGRELNASSDIDLVFIYREEGRTDGGPLPAIGCADFFARVGRRVIQLLGDVTADGFVFRVDMRLRPHGDAGPLAIGLPALEEYLITEGREWERFAWLKSRQIADTGLAPGQDRAADGAALEALVRPFVWRRYLDFGAFDALKDLHGRIRAEAGRREARRGGIDVKLGRGGIREIEFIAQLFQIVRGGHDPGLRSRSTLETLAALASRGLVPRDECARLAEDYDWLRRVEHALQYREDAQTHTLPDDDDARTQAAWLLRVDPPELAARLAASRERVARVFDALLAPAGGQEAPNGNGAAPPASTAPPDDAAESAGLPESVITRIDALRSSRRWNAARTETRAALDRLLARLRAVPGDPDGVVRARLVDLFESVLGRPSYLLLLDRFPAALERLARTVARSRWASDYLLKHPVVLDELLDGQLLEPVDYDAWARELAARIAMLADAAPQGGPDVERQMDLARAAHHAQVFRLLVQDLEGLLTIERLSDHLSELADQVLGVTIPVVWSQLRIAHAPVPRFAAIAYGRLGGKELGYASDLDLVFLYDDDDPRAPEAYALLAQRLMGWLSSRTAAGVLFEVDLRLRPNGNAGMLVSSVDAYERYQRESAWVWEHQALTRARFAAGFAPIGPRFEALRRELLARPRDPAALATEVIAMRRKVADGHPNRSALFDLKHDRGGLIDVEFAVQYLVLAYGATHAPLLDDVGNIALLARAAEAGLLDPEIARAAGDAYRGYRALQHRLRLDDASYARVAPDTVTTEVAAVCTLWDAVLGGR